MSRLAGKSTAQDEVVCLATAAILMGAAAIEALLSEAAYIVKPELYKEENDFRRLGVPRKFKMLTGKELKDACPDGDELWGWRLALSHAEPNHKRTRFVGARINAEGARWAAETTERLAVMIWGAHMPRLLVIATLFGSPHVSVRVSEFRLMLYVSKMVRPPGFGRRSLAWKTNGRTTAMS